MVGGVDPKWRFVDRGVCFFPVRIVHKRTHLEIKVGYAFRVARLRLHRGEHDALARICLAVHVQLRRVLDSAAVAGRLPVCTQLHEANAGGPVKSVHLLRQLRRREVGGVVG
eukprot:scaffold84687_cov57-Phaeocystis_antarctica.AAC.2